MYRSTAKTFEEFERSHIWLDILDELKLWLNDVHETMEDPEEMVTDRLQARLRGNAESIRNFMLLPETIRKNIEEDLKREEK